MATTQYITTENERWDTIAYKVYGNASLANEIIAANPLVPIVDKLPAGTVLDIPVKEEIEVLPESDKLPIWKQ